MDGTKLCSRRKAVRQNVVRHIPRYRCQTEILAMHARPLRPAVTMQHAARKQWQQVGMPQWTSRDRPRGGRIAARESDSERAFKHVRVRAPSHPLQTNPGPNPKTGCPSDKRQHATSIRRSPAKPASTR